VTDRVEDAVAWALLACALFVVAVGVVTGMAVYAATVERARVEAAERTPTTAVLVQDVPTVPVTNPTSGRMPVTATWRDADGAVHPVRAGDVNAYLCGIAGRRLSLKDFRTLIASAAVLEVLAATEPASNERARRSQLRSAVTAVAEELANTPTVCRKSYVHEAVVTAFEQGALARLRKPTRSPIKKAEVLARIVARHGS